MTHSVILPYREDERVFYIHLEGGSGRPYIHEFRPTPIVAAWLEGRSLVSYRTLTDGNPHLEAFSVMEFIFIDADDALLFKLTWA